MASYHWVSGYYRKDGTYVKGHYQTNPNSTTSDNWSTDGNVNPFTGKPGTLPNDGGTATISTTLTTSTGGTSTSVTSTTGTTSTTSTTTNSTKLLATLSKPASDYSQRISSTPSSLISAISWPAQSYISIGASKSPTYENEGSQSFIYDLDHEFVIVSLRNDSSYRVNLTGGTSSAHIWLYDGAGYQVSAAGAGTTDVSFQPAVSGQYIFWIYDDSKAHQVTFGLTEDVGKDGRNSATNPAPVIYNHTVSKSNSLVDETFYKASNPDIAAANIDPAQHFKQFGWQEARDPNPWFDTGFYLEQNADVRTSGMNPLEHYDRYGWKEGRDPSLTFSTSSYLTKNPDVARAGVDPLAHFVQYGYSEGRPYAASVLAAAL